MKTIIRFFFGLIGLVAFISCIKTIPRLAKISPTTPVVTSADTVAFPDELSIVCDEINDTLKSGKFIYLTIDDSPLNGSRYIDSVIRVTSVKTSIFMVGHPIDESSRFKKNYELLGSNPYIEIYNHSYSHANHRYLKYYKKPEDVVDDFEKNRIDFKIPYRIARLPGRNLWQIAGKTKNYKQTGAQAAQLLADKGYKIFGWDVEWKYEAKDNTPIQTIDDLLEEIETLYNSSNTFTAGHIVLLMHDQMFSKRNENNDLEKLIRKLQENGFTFKYLRSYPNPSLSDPS